MKRPSRGYIVFLLAGVLGGVGGTAWAEDPAPSGGAAPAAPMAMPRKFTGDQQAFFIAGGVADSTTWTIGTTLPAGVTISVGLNINYNGNGLPGPTGMPSSDKFAFSGVLYGAYYIVNKFPVGIAVEAALVEPLSPTAGSPATVVQPGIGIFYAPFPAPIVLGSGLDLQIVIPKNGSTVVQTVTPGLRIVYVF
ncbi:MAG TPA: hypothetical protein VF516_40010 [Kofleriaceae bacterium]